MTRDSFNQLKKLHPWNAVENLSPVMMLTPVGVVSLEPLYEAVEHGKEDEVPVVIVLKETAQYLGENGSVNLIVAIPGMCGHFDCGGTVRVSLN